MEGVVGCTEFEKSKQKFTYAEAREEGKNNLSGSHHLSNYIGFSRTV